MLRDIGGLYLILSGTLAVSAFVVSVRRGQSVELEEVMRWLGIAGVIVWFCVLFGAASWLVSLPFAGAFGLMDWLVRSTGSPVLVPVAIVMLLLIGLGVGGSVSRRQRLRADNRANTRDTARSQVP